MRCYLSVAWDYRWSYWARAFLRRDRTVRRLIVVAQGHMFRLFAFDQARYVTSSGAMGTSLSVYRARGACQAGGPCDMADRNAYGELAGAGVR